MMNIEQKLLTDAIEARTRQDMAEPDAWRYPDDYFYDANETDSPKPATLRASLKPDELALHQQLLEMARASAAAPPSDSFVG